MSDKPTFALGPITNTWNPDFLAIDTPLSQRPSFLIILNQPVSLALLRKLWSTTNWHACADGGANRLYDLFECDNTRDLFLPDLIKGDLDSARPNVLHYYKEKGVRIIQDKDVNSTDLMKCMQAVDAIDPKVGNYVAIVILLGGLTGRLDQTIHTLSYLHKLRKSGRKIYAVTDDNVAWVLDAGDHRIAVDHKMYGPTCGLLPVGILSTMLTTTGLRWNLSETESSFEGLVSTSNHLIPEEKEVWVRTTQPIWWTMELKTFE
ncbi:thiamine pyrophosphokinase Thi80 [Flagelloscypha sp. PMI_526]|nr:thiamine pyrophosphokinase Thi80 [Flagelloscypha sp. PMI_526]